jgi:hypothetical protein
MIIKELIIVNLKILSLMLIISILILFFTSNFNDINYVAYSTLFINLFHYMVVVFYKNRNVFVGLIKHYQYISLSLLLLLTYIISSLLKLNGPTVFNNNRIEWLFFVGFSTIICLISNILADKIIYKKLCN